MNEKLSVTHNGNEKLGNKISVFSRPVGDTCPDSCEFLDNGCYAERIEYRFPNTRKAYLKNLKIADWQKLRAFLLEAKKKGNAVRLHANGDFIKTNTVGSKILDRKYINDLTRAIKSIDEPPLIFAYTHVLKKEVANLQKVGVKIYASIDNTKAYREAKKVGFKLFAFSSNLRKNIDKNKMYTTELGQEIPVCWEQWCEKRSTCSTCMYCVKGIGNISFMKH